MKCKRENARRLRDAAERRRNKVLLAKGRRAGEGFHDAWNRYHECIRAIRQRAYDCKCDACVEKRVMDLMSGMTETDMQKELLREIYGTQRPR